MSKPLSKKIIPIVLLLLLTITVVTLIRFRGINDSSEYDRMAVRSVGPDRVRRPPTHTEVKAVQSKLNSSIAELQKRQSISRSEAEQLIADSEKLFPDVMERSRYCSSVLKKLCESGLSSEAWDLIDPNHGILRRSEMSQFFASADLPDKELLNKLTSDENVIETSLNGYLRRFRSSELTDKVLSEEFKTALGDLYTKNRISFSLGGTFMIALHEANPEQMPDILKTARELHAAGMLEDSRLYTIGNNHKFGPIFERWKNFQNTGDSPDSAVDHSEPRKQMINDMIESDSEKALDTIIAGGNPQSAADFKVAIEKLLEVDSGKPTTWYAENASRLSPVEKDMFAAAHIEASLEYNETDSAVLWLQKIGDQKTREELKNRIDSKISETNARN